MKVLKLRGSAFRSGDHAYRLSSEGIRAYPRLADPVDPSAYPMSSERTSSGIPALDQLLDEGYWRGASTLVVGPSGSGKTLMGLHFIYNGATSGEPGVFATLQENPTQLARIVQGFGWTLAEENVHLMYRPPVDFYLDEWVYDLLDMVERTGARRIVVDSLADLEWASPDATRFREYVYSLANRCSRLGISILMTYEIPELYGALRLSEFGASHLSDNVVMLQFQRDDSIARRALTVLKTRASANRPETHEFRIGPEGIVLAREVGPGGE